MKKVYFKNELIEYKTLTDLRKKLGYGVKLGNDVRLGNDVELGNFVRLGNFVKLGNNVRLGNDVELGNKAKMLNDTKLLKIIEFNNFYKYKAMLYIDENTKKPVIQLGCFVRFLEDWESDFYNNDNEFPEGSPEAELRLSLFNLMKIIIKEL